MKSVFLFLALLVASTVAIASGPQQYQGTTTGGQTMHWFDDEVTACTELANYQSALLQYDWVFWANVPPVCGYRYVAHPDTGYSTAPYNVRCKYGGTGATAKYGHDGSTNSCTPAPTLPADPNCPVGMHVYTWATPEDPQFPPQPICMPDGDPNTQIPDTIPDSQCSYRNPITNKCESACPNGSYYGQVPTGAMACIKTATGKVDNDNLPADCPRGYMNISATAEPNCAPVSSNAPGQPTRPPGSAGETTKPTPSTTQTTTGQWSTITNSDGGTTATQDTTVKNRDGSTTTTTTTRVTDAGGNVTESTSSTTGNTPGGAVGKSDSQTNDKSDLCIRHPELDICKVSSVTQADCAATVCTGDAIQCAILRQNIKQYCEDRKDTPASTLGGQIMSGTDPLGSSLPSSSNGSNLDFGATQIDATGFLGGGSGLTDKVITVRGQTITIPLAQMNQYLLGLRAAIMILALLSSFRMVSGVIFRE